MPRVVSAVQTWLRWAVDTMGRPDQLKRGSTVLADFAWNPDGTLASRVDGSDTGTIGTTSFTYDWADRLTGATLPSGWTTTNPSFAWRADGLIKSRTWNGGSAAAFSYDRAKRLTGIAKGSLSFGQTYDRDGNVTSESRSLGFSGDAGAGTQTFAYDALNRVLSSSGLGAGHNMTYRYDLDGNRTYKSDGTTTWTYGYDQTDQLASLNGGPTTFGSDAFGNLTAKWEDDGTQTTYVYDLADKLTSIDRPGTTSDTTFSPDALGRIGGRAVGGPSVTQTYSYVGTSETVSRIHDVTPASDTDSIVDALGDRLGVKVGSAVNWFLPDPHGNIAASLSADEATVVNATRYDPYGEVLLTGSGGGSAVGADRWKYQGRLDVSPTGVDPLYDMSARFYAPSIGTFTSLDTVAGTAQNPLSMNRFLYAHANPATLIDPSGHASLGQGQACSSMADYCSTPSASTSSGTTPTRNTHARKDDDYTYSPTGGKQPSTKSAKKDETTKPTTSVPAIPTWLWAEYKDYLTSPQYLYHDRQIHPVLYDNEGDAILHLLSWYAFVLSSVASPGATASGELAASACGAGDTLCQIAASAIGGGAYGLGKGGLKTLTSTLGKSAITAFGESGATTARSWADLLVSRAAKGGENQAQAEGIVYLRTDLNGGKPYVGQTASEGRFVARQSEHARANPDADFEFEYLGRAQPGLALDRLEEYWIRALGGPTNVRNPGGFLANARHQMNDARYGAAGGDPLP